MTTFDVIVIGSGAGGAPVAARLAAAGRTVLVVERGVSYTKVDFDRDEIEWCRRDRFVPSPRTDPHTRRNDEGQKAQPTSDGWISTVVGGGTVHMGGYFLRARPDDAMQGTRLKAEVGHSAIDWAVPFKDVAKHYAIAETELGVSGAPAAQGGGTAPLNAHPLAVQVDAAARSLGFTSQPTPRAILSAARPDEDRQACTYHEQCASYGCPDDAKASMPVTYLRRGAKSGKLTVWSETMALKIETAGGVATGVRVRRLKEGEEVVQAGVVVVACGAIETARLLLLSGLNESKQTGKNLWFSLFVETTGFLPRDKHADVMTGSPFVNRTVDAGGGTMQVGFVHDNPIHRAERAATESGPGLLWGRALKQELLRTFTQGRSVVVEAFGESVPHIGSYVDLDPQVKDRFGLPAARITHFHHGRDVKVAKKLADDGAALLKGIGAENVKTTRSMSETLVLQGGTCRFGADPQTSGCDPNGRVHGTKNVYVTDGAALPSSTTVPITLTIIANALRTADKIGK